MTGSFTGRGNQYIQLVKVLYCKLPTSGKQLPAFPHKVRGLNRRPHRWDASMLPLRHPGPRLAPSLCISHPTKSDIHEIIMHPPEEGKC